MKNIKSNVNAWQGFTLLELMITLAIAAILVAAAAPSFGTFIDGQKLVSAASEFFSGINLTRAEAIKRGGKVMMMPTDGISWNSGWIIFVDTNSNFAYDTSDTLVFKHDPIPTTIVVTNSFTDNSAMYMAFTGTGRGRTNASSQQPQAGTVSFTLGSNIRRVKINFLGRGRICNPATDIFTCAINASGD